MIVLDFCRGLAATGAVLAPGWYLARQLGLRQPLVAGFVLGSVACYGLVTLLAVAGAFSRPVALAGWVVVAGAMGVVGRRRKKVPPQPSASEPRPPIWLFLPLIPAAAVVLYRVCVSPLFGIDTVFRWNFLAEQIVRHGTLAFYPPVTAEDFTLYGWPDGIAPLVSSLYAWLYAATGTTAPIVTSPFVLVQVVVLMQAGYGLAARAFSARAGAITVALLASCPLVLWSTAMGQETGFTAIAATALLLYLPASVNDEELGAVTLAALAAGMGALAREYGLILPLLGAAFILSRRLTRRATLVFVAVAGVVALPWYARNFVLTGNPVYSLSVGTLFPVNEVHRWLDEAYRETLGLTHLPPEAPRLLVTQTLVLLLAGTAGAFVFWRRQPAALATIGAMVAVWLASIGHTAAGFTTSLRVLNPALVVAAVLGGGILATWPPALRQARALGLGLVLFASDAAVRALTLPANTYRLPLDAWLSAGGAVHAYHERPIYQELVRVVGSERVLVLGPAALLTRLGARTLPPWSPEVRYLFDEQVSPEDAARRLRAAGIGYVLLNTGEVNARFLAHSRFFRDPGRSLPHVWSDPDMILLRVRPDTP